MNQFLTKANRISPETWDVFCRHPDEERFRRLYDPTKGLVYGICRRILTDEEDARDAFQSTYTRLVALAKNAPQTSVVGDAEQLIRRLAVLEAMAVVRIYPYALLPLNLQAQPCKLQ